MCNITVAVAVAAVDAVAVAAVDAVATVAVIAISVIAVALIAVVVIVIAVIVVTVTTLHWHGSCHCCCNSCYLTAIFPFFPFSQPLPL